MVHSTDKHSHADIRLRAVRGSKRNDESGTPHFPLTAADKADLSRLAQVIEYKTAGSTIFMQGDAAIYSYLLADGLVRVSHTLANGERQVVAFHWPGDLFGLASDGRFINSAETIEAARVYRFPVHKLEDFLLKNPRIQDGFLVKATHDLRATQRQLVVLGRFDIPRRLAVFLLECATHEHYFESSGKILTLPMSRSDIADYLGTSAETVTRALAKLEAEGLLLRTTPRALELRPDKLRTFAGLE
jgi:CRP-like cAMP-binding protein